MRRGSAAVARLAGALLVLGSASPARGDPAAANAADPAPPNVVFVVSDDHAWTDYGFMGHPRVRTPNLDRLAAEGLAFTRGYVPSSLCSPSLATIVTGLYPHQHGITSNDPPVPAGLPKDEASESGAYRAGRRALAELMARARPLPERLAARGYRSLQTGKWWPGSYASGGFTHGMTLDRPGDRRHGGDGLVIGRETLAPIFDFVTAARREGRPFFVWYAPMLPHEPHDPPARLLAHYEGLASPELARYWAMVEWLDETVGRLLAFLDEADLARNTLVVYLADNGWLPDSGGPGARKRSKGSPHDAGLRTPILLRWPGRIAPGRSGALAGSIDLVPTVLRAAGLPRDPALPGIDLTDAGTVAARGRLFGACFTHHAVDLGDPARSLRWRWVIEGRWKLIAPAAQNEPDAAPELYDLEADPLERSDLAGSHAARVAALRAELDAWWTGAP